MFVPLAGAVCSDWYITEEPKREHLILSAVSLHSRSLNGKQESQAPTSYFTLALIHMLSLK